MQICFNQGGRRERDIERNRKCMLISASEFQSDLKYTWNFER